MSEIEQKIFDEIKNNPGSTGKQIAKVIGHKKEEINKTLANSEKLNQLCRRDTDGKWYCRDASSSEANATESEWEPNCGVISDSIIRAWVRQAVETTEQPPYKYFTQFAFLWFAFNAYYSEAYKNDPEINSELGAIIWCASHIPEDVIRKVITCEGFRAIANWLEDIKKMDYKNDGEVAYGYSLIADDRPRQRFTGLIRILYVVRCNLFHGHKSIINARDQQVVKASVDCLMCLMTNLLYL